MEGRQHFSPANSSNSLKTSLLPSMYSANHANKISVLVLNSEVLSKDNMINCLIDYSIDSGLNLTS